MIDLCLIVPFARTNVAVIAGGVAGGVVGLLGLAALAICCLRRRRHIQSLNDRPSPLLRPGPEPRFADSASENPFASTGAISMSRVPGASRPLQAWTESDATSNFTAGHDPTISSPTGNLSHMRATSSGNDSSVPSPASAVVSSADVGAATAGVPQESSPPIRLLPIPGSSSYPNEKSRQPSLHSISASVHASPDAPAARPNPTLTDGQADFVNSLFNNNVPAAVVARVLERMLANPQGGSGTGANDPELHAHFGTDNPPAGPWLSGATEFGDGETTFGTAPPSYDFVRAQ
ncbi:hypothetical protein PAXRUDRAFT_452289 [Paxillus rubicundulus Ve08.2h10]|uniref:Uncharacterized protein n=1 Tax=Paxillus rubicundulus Ve08.2h10 TaxID=930991 RepID=A0A0D0E9U6_9AGAM|nr:hypothetical protein PAXRUDRAFT_452289 [Paxillus rubicundulus Ve08.2h10]